MYTALLHSHNLLAWLVLGTGLYVAVRGLRAGAAWSAADGGWMRRFVLLVHLQLVAGLALWFTSPGVAAAREAMAATMRDAALRRLVVEHPTLMLLAVVIATVTGVRVKRAAEPDVAARRAAVGTLITLLCVAAVLPWNRLVGSWLP